MTRQNPSDEASRKVPVYSAVPYQFFHFQSDRSNQTQAGAVFRIFVGLILFSGATGDLVTTFIGLQVGAVELHPVGSTIIQNLGFAGVVAAKGTIVSCVLASWKGLGWIDAPYRSVVPIVVGSLWIAVSGWNLTVIARLIV